MKLTNRKLGLLAAGALVAIAAAQSRIADAIPTFYAASPMPYCSVDVNGQPPSCVSIDPAHFGFSALRGM